MALKEKNKKDDKTHLNLGGGGGGGGPFTSFT